MNRFRNLVSQWDEPTRRQFLRSTAQGVLGVTAYHGLSQHLEGASTSVEGDSAARQSTPPSGMAKRVIYLYMVGGMSQLDTLDPKPGKSTQGPVEAIRTKVSGIQVSEYFPRLAQQMNDVALIRSLSSNQGAHAQGRYFMHTSYFMRGTITHPELGAYGAMLLPHHHDRLPAHVKIGEESSGLGAGFLESKYAALPIGDPEEGLQHSQLSPRMTPQRFHRRLERVEQMNRVFAKKYDTKPVRAYQGIYADAVKLMESKDLQAFDLQQEPEKLRDAYGDEKFGQGCLLARRLVEHGVRFVEVTLGGWDTHTDNFTRVEELSAVLDQGISALLEDLRQRGMLRDTLVVVATEFGRTPDIVGGNNGRNHYPKAFSCLLAGGGIQGGQAWGKTDEEGYEVTDQLVSVPDFNATVAYAMGLPLEREIISPSQRPFKVAADGHPVIELFTSTPPTDSRGT